MARLPSLVAALRDLDARGPAGVGNVARRVREAGLIRTTSRGVGAAEMTSRDAANLLLGLKGAPLYVGLIGDTTRRAPTAVMEFSSLVRLGASTSEDPYWIDEVFEADTFGEALAAAIEHAPHLLRRWIALSGVIDPGGPAELIRHRALLACGLRITLVRPLLAIVEEILPEQIQGPRRSVSFIRDATRRDYLPAPGEDSLSITFGFTTVMALHQALKSEAGGSRSTEGTAAVPASPSEGSVVMTSPGGTIEEPAR
jgi:hypothetical protein